MTTPASSPPSAAEQALLDFARRVAQDPPAAALTIAGLALASAALGAPVQAEEIATELGKSGGDCAPETIERLLCGCPLIECSTDGAPSGDPARTRHRGRSSPRVRWTESLRCYFRQERSREQATRARRGQEVSRSPVSFRDKMDRLAALLMTSESVSRFEGAAASGWCPVRTLEVLSVLQEEGLIAAAGTRPVPGRRGGNQIRLFKAIPGVIIPADWTETKSLREDRARAAELREKGLCRFCEETNPDTEMFAACEECRRVDRLRRGGSGGRGQAFDKRLLLEALKQGPATQLEMARALERAPSTISAAVKHYRGSGRIVVAGARRIGRKRASLWKLVESAPSAGVGAC